MSQKIPEGPFATFFAEDSVSDSEGKRTATEQESSSFVNSVPDVRISPGKLVTTTTTNKDKQKLRSLFRHCICLPAVH